MHKNKYGFSGSSIDFQGDREGAGMPKSKSLGSFCVFPSRWSFFRSRPLARGRKRATPMPVLAGWLSSGQVVRNRCYGMHRHPQSRVFRSCEQLQLWHIQRRLCARVACRSSVIWGLNLRINTCEKRRFTIICIIKEARSPRCSLCTGDLIICEEPTFNWSMPRVTF